MMIELLKKISYKVVLLISGLIVFYLFSQSLFTSVRIDQYERPMIIDEMKIVKVIVFIALVGIFYLWINKIDTISDKALKIIAYGYVTIEAIFVLVTQNSPHTDMLHVMECAESIYVGDFSCLENGGYLNVFPVNSGVVLLCLIITIIGGSMNYILFQLLNVFLSGLCMHCILKCKKEDNEVFRFDVLLISIVIFIPLLFYNNLVYGNMIGLYLGIISLIYQYRFLTGSLKKDAIISMICISIAGVLKTNFYIYLIALIIVYILHISNNNWKTIFLICVANVLLFSGCNSLSSHIIPWLAGDTSYRPEGAPKTAWMVIGLNDDNGDRGAGWYFPYTTAVLTESDYQYDVASQISKDKLLSQVKYLADNPKIAIAFFHKKITSMWCESSFQSFYWNRIGCNKSVGFHSEWYNDLVSYTGKTNRIIYTFLDGYQIFVYFGALLYIIYSFSIVNFDKVIGLITFIGGFLFQVIWEAKSMYVLMYFVLLIPYAVMGYCSLLSNISSKGQPTIKGLDTKRVVSIVALVLAMCIGLLLKMDSGNEAWNKWLNEHRFIQPRYYDLVSNINSEYKIKDIYLDINVDDNWYYTFTTDNVDILEGQWRIEREGGAYVIRYWEDMNKVITYDSANGCIILTDYISGDKSQLWELKK